MLYQVHLTTDKLYHIMLYHQLITDNLILFCVLQAREFTDASDHYLPDDSNTSYKVDRKLSIHHLHHKDI